MIQAVTFLSPIIWRSQITIPKRAHNIARYIFLLDSWFQTCLVFWKIFQLDLDFSELKPSARFTEHSARGFVTVQGWKYASQLPLFSCINRWPSTPIVRVKKHMLEGFSVKGGMTNPQYKEGLCMALVCFGEGPGWFFIFNLQEVLRADFEKFGEISRFFFHRTGGKK